MGFFIFKEEEGTVVVLAAILFVSFAAALLDSSYSEVLAVLSLAVLSASALSSRWHYPDEEFSSIALAFLCFGVLFLMAELIFAYHTRIASLGPNIPYLLSILWIVGILPPIWVCWRTVLRYSEYVNMQSFILIILVVFSSSVLLLVTIGTTVATSHNYPGIVNKIVAVTYPYLDAILLMGLLTLLHIYRKGRLERYWETITLGIFLFTLADMGNAAAEAYGSSLSTLFTGLYSASYLTMAYGFALVAYRKRRSNVMAPGRMYRIREVFLIHSSGILAAYVPANASTDEKQGNEEKLQESRETKPTPEPEGSGIDRDILGGMLTAVQTFIRDSFDQETWKEGEESELKRLQYGGLEINVENGKYTFLAVVLDGKGTEHLHKEMICLLEKLEKDYGTVLEKWNGQMDLLDGVEDTIRERLL